VTIRSRVYEIKIRGVASDLVRAEFDDVEVWEAPGVTWLRTGEADTAALYGLIRRIEALGLGITANAIRSGLVACTGNVGCKFAASDTKRHAEDIARWCDTRVALDTPVNIHLTGCHHSCAQHYISDIGLIAAKVPVGDTDDTVEGYHLFAGGGFGPDADIGQEVYHDLKAEDAPQTVEKLLKAYLAHRADPSETFLTFARRHDGESLRKLAEAETSS